MNWVKLQGLVEYSEALELMEARLSQVISNESDETVYLLEHHGVYTAGTNYREEELLENTNIPIIYTGRGGKYTYHGPGQAITYPIIDLRKQNREKDVRLYVKNLEQIIINTLKNFDISAYTIEDKIGIWVNNSQNIPSKIAAIGIRIKKWVTYHGIAVNIFTDLQKYKSIIPCGIANFPVTSLYELGIEISIDDFNFILKKEFEKIFK
jgi:lipoyl(octanoyl) transferase